MLSQKWWQMPVTSSRRGQAKDDYMFKASLAYIMSSRIARAIRQDPILKNYDQKKIATLPKMWEIYTLIKGKGTNQN